MAKNFKTQRNPGLSKSIAPSAQFVNLLRLRRNSLIHSLIHSLIYSLIYSLIHSLIFLLSTLFFCVLKFLATRLSAISFLWPRPPQRDDASKKIVCSTRVGSQIRKKTARAKAQTLHFHLQTSIPVEIERAGIGSGLLWLMQGGSSGSPESGSLGLVLPPLADLVDPLRYAHGAMCLQVSDIVDREPCPWAISTRPG